MSLGAVISLGALLVAGALCLGRLLRPGSISDRVVAVDALLVIVVCGLAVHAAGSGDGTYLDLHVVAALLGFVGTAMVSRLLRRRSS